MTGLSTNPGKDPRHTHTPPLTPIIIIANKLLAITWTETGDTRGFQSELEYSWISVRMWDWELNSGNRIFTEPLCRCHTTWWSGSCCLSQAAWLAEAPTSDESNFPISWSLFNKWGSAKSSWSGSSCFQGRKKTNHNNYAALLSWSIFGMYIDNE